MARARSTDTPEEDIVNTHVKFPKALHREAKIYAVTNGISLKDLILGALRNELDRSKKKSRGGT